MRGFLRLVSFTVVLASSTAGRLAAQDSSGSEALARAGAFAHSGRTEEARAVLVEWWDRGRPTAPRSEREHGAWLRALLTVDPEQARIEYRRLVVEFPGGRYAAPALTRIARIAEASGDTAGARSAWEALLREHSGSAPASLARERLAAYSGGSGSAGGANVAETPGGTRNEPSVPATDRALDHAVQLGAFSSVGRARELVERARAAGLTPRLVTVPGSDLIRVRLGRFADEPEAESLAGRARSLGFDALVVGEASRERAAG